MQLSRCPKKLIKTSWWGLKGWGLVSVASEFGTNKTVRPDYGRGFQGNVLIFLKVFPLLADADLTGLLAGWAGVARLVRPEERVPSAFRAYGSGVRYVLKLFLLLDYSPA